ncbi:hypothetical protein POVCU2_0081230 [Plasmodium ovale curtisi]|uniref:Uncharacterized protein n=1 Tax=Plasmodium ovale curtisi TaxID=864141 RepID=A0A1A8WMK4_PLAOA|nr:hypothetical protein POVCU2_0081230 [Plasmodium ovale curtisi]
MNRTPRSSSPQLTLSVLTNGVKTRGKTRGKAWLKRGEGKTMGQYEIGKKRREKREGKKGKGKKRREKREGKKGKGKKGKEKREGKKGDKMKGKESGNNIRIEATMEHM